MTKTTRLSNISIAAIILLAASASGFAQGQSTEVRAEASNIVAMTAPIPAAFSTSPKLTTNESPVGILNVDTKTATDVIPRGLSLEVFRTRIGQLAAVENQVFLEKQTTIYEVGLGNSKKQFRTDDDNTGAGQKKGITFVPSLGQKLPS